MGLLDKVKEGAASATAAAKDAAQKGQAKLDSVQTKKASDALLRDLGAAYYAQWTKRGDENANAAVIERLVGALQKHEDEHGPIDLTITETGSGSGGIPESGSGGIPESGSGGIPESGSGGIPESGSGGIPQSGSGGIPQSGSGGIPQA